MFSLSRWKGKVKETLKSTKQRKESSSTINNNNNRNIFGRTKDRDQQPMTATTHNACDGDDGIGIPSADKTETRRSNNNSNIFKRLRFLPFLSKQKEKEREERVDAKEEDAMQEGGGRRKQNKKHDSRDENDGSKWRGRGLKWRKKKKGSAAHNSNDTASTATNGDVDAYAYVDKSKNENENESNVTRTVMKSITVAGEEAEAAGTRAAEEKSEPRGLMPVYRFRTLDVFPRSLRHTLNDPETPTLSKTAAVASSSSSVSSFATYNAKADSKNNNTNKNALDATTTTTTTTTRTGANYYYRHRLRRVLSVEFIHDIEADTIDVPWSSSSPPSPLLTQSPLSQQQELENKREHEIEHELELEHGPQQQEQEHQADYLTAAPAAAHASPIPLRPVLTHRPPFEPNLIQIHDSQSLSVLDDDDDDDDASTVLLEPFKQEDVTSVPASLDVTKAIAKTEIASLWTTQSCSSLSSSSSSLMLSLSEKTSAPNLDRVSSVVSFLPLPVPVPVKFVSAQGPGRVLEQPSDQSASLEKKVYQATAPISGTEWSTSNTSDKEKEEDEGRNLFLPPPPPSADITPSSHRAEENIFSRRFCSEDQEHPSSISHSLGSHSPSPSYSHSPTCQQELDQGHHQQDPSGLTISHTINDNNSHSDSHGDKRQLKDQHVSRLWPVLPYDLEVKAALDECLGDIYHFTSSAPNSAANSRYSTRTSHDDSKSVYQYEGPMDEGCDVYHDYQAPLPSPPLLKGIVATTTVTTAVADAVRLDQDKSSTASSPQQLYQQLLSSSPLVASSAGSTKSLLIASTLPLPPVAILVLDRKEPIRAAEVTGDLESMDLPPVLLPGQQEDLVEQYPRAMTVKRASTAEVLDKGFLNGLFAGTVSRWTRPTPTTAPVPPIMITTSAMASTTSPLLRHVNRGRGLAAQSGDLADMDPFWDF